MSLQPKESDTLVNIPQEIFDLVVHHATYDHNSLLNLCLTSSCFQHEAQRLLYHEIRIENDSRPPTGSRAFSICVSRASQLFSTLTQHNPTLAKHVRILCHCVFLREADQEYWSLLSKSVALMNNVEELTLYRHIPHGLFPSCTSLRLRTFECDHTCVFSSFRTRILDFLATQPDLKSLFIVWDSDEPFPETHCRNLTSLAGDRYTIEQVLPGRESTITRLTWAPARQGDHDTPRIDRIIPGLSNIHIFSLGGYYLRPSLTDLAPYLRSLQVLRLIGVARNVDILDECNHVPSLPNLRVFVWSSGPSMEIDWDSYFPVAREKQQDLVIKWFRATKSLEAAYFQVANSKITPDSCYLCWTRNEDNPAFVDFQKAVKGHRLTAWFS